MPSLPVVTGDKVPAGPTHDRRMEFFDQCQRVGPHALDVIRGHERKTADPQVARLRERHRQAGRIGGRSGRESEIVFIVAVADPIQYDTLSVLFSRSPSNANLDGRRCADMREDRVADVFLAAEQADAALLNPASAVFGVLDPDDHAMIAGVGARRGRASL